MRIGRKIALVVGSIVGLWLIVNIVYYGVRMDRTPLGGNPSHSDAVRSAWREMCFRGVLRVADQLLYYAKTHGGNLPPNGWDSKNQRPKWVSAVIDMQPNGELKDHYLPMMKCPEDSSGEPVSYECPFAGENINRIPKDQWGHTVLLREREFRYSHHYVVYLDRNIE